jgi:D-3-phosphoglycerate dehydrogenase
MSSTTHKVLVLNVARYADLLAAAARPLPVEIVHHPFALPWSEIADRRAGRLATATTAPDDLRPLLAEARVVLAFGLPLDTAALAPHLRWVETPATGVDQLNGSGVLESPDIAVTSIGGLFAPWVAEHVFALLFALRRKLALFHDAQRRAAWEPRTIDELHGHTMAIVGLGNIGKAVAAAARAFGMRVLATRRSDTPSPEVDRLYRPSELRAMLAAADVVVLAVAGNAETRHLIGAAELAAMPAHAQLINVARGIVVDEAALAAALRDGSIGGAGLDAFVTEPLPADSPLWTAPNTVLTPHIAPNLENKLEHCLRHFAVNLARYCNGEPLLDRV